MTKRFYLLTALLPLCALTGAEKLHEQYGVTTHPMRWGYPEYRQEVEKTAGCGVHYLRLSAYRFIREKGPENLDFKKFDQVLEAAKKNNVKLLPLLGSEQQRPYNKYKKERDEYIRKMITLYGSHFTWWQIDNEPDKEHYVEFFRKPEAYARFLADTTRDIRKYSPNAKIVTAGFSSILFRYIEPFLKAAQKDSFDALSVHPYYMQGYPEDSLAYELKRLRGMMDKYGFKDKKIWISESGLTTSQPVDLTSITAAALKRLKLDSPDIPITLIHDNNYRYASDHNIPRESLYGKNRRYHSINFNELKNLDPKKYPLLQLAPLAGFPMVYGADLLKYIKHGGTVFSPGNIPLYSNIRKFSDGHIYSYGNLEKVQKEFHIGWDTWWRTKDTPRRITKSKAAPGYENIKLPRPVARFLCPRNLKGNDRLEPIVIGSSDDGKFSAPIAGIFRFDSDLKGNFIVYQYLDYTERISEDQQARHLPRTILISFGCGVDKVFWYCLRSNEAVLDSKEYNFGIIHRDLSPKPAYHAYSTLTTLCPSGATRPVITEKNGVYQARWTHPDGRKITAVWSVILPVKSDLDAKNFTSAVDYLGRKVKLPKGRITATNGILYLINK